MEQIERIERAIRRERAYQDRKYGCPQDRGLLLAEYLHIAQNELNEAFNSLADGDVANARCEALQTATVLVAALQQHGLVERE